MSTQNSEPIRVFLIDDHRSILWGLERLIESGRPAMRVVGSATSCNEAVGALDKALPDVILLDLDLGTESGMDAIPKLLEASRTLGDAMPGLEISKVPEGELMQTRGW